MKEGEKKKSQEERDERKKNPKYLGRREQQGGARNRGLFGKEN